MVRKAIILLVLGMVLVGMTPTAISESNGEYNGEGQNDGDMNTPHDHDGGPNQYEECAHLGWQDGE